MPSLRIYWYSHLKTHMPSVCSSLAKQQRLCQSHKSIFSSVHEQLVLEVAQLFKPDTPEFPESHNCSWAPTCNSHNPTASTPDWLQSYPFPCSLFLAILFFSSPSCTDCCNSLVPTPMASAASWSCPTFSQYKLFPRVLFPSVLLVNGLGSGFEACGVFCLFVCLGFCFVFCLQYSHP